MNSFHAVSDAMPFRGTAKVRNIVRVPECHVAFTHPAQQACCSMSRFQGLSVLPLRIAASCYADVF